jgi:hypothetical protein
MKIISMMPQKESDFNVAGVRIQLLVSGNGREISKSRSKLEYD